MAQVCDFSKELFFIWIPMQGGQDGWRLPSAGGWPEHSPDLG